jgi:hypothetical protein
MGWRAFSIVAVALWVLSSAAQIQRWAAERAAAQCQQEAMLLAQAFGPRSPAPGAVAASLGKVPRGPEFDSTRQRVAQEVARARDEAEKKFQEIDLNYAREMCILHRLWIEDIDAKLKSPRTRDRGEQLEQRRRWYENDARKYCGVL